MTGRARGSARGRSRGSTEEADAGPWVVYVNSPETPPRQQDQPDVGTFTPQSILQTNQQDGGEYVPYPVGFLVGAQDDCPPQYRLLMAQTSPTISQPTTPITPQAMTDMPYPVHLSAATQGDLSPEFYYRRNQPSALAVESMVLKLACTDSPLSMRQSSLISHAEQSDDDESLPRELAAIQLAKEDHEKVHLEEHRAPDNPIYVFPPRLVQVPRRRAQAVRKLGPRPAQVVVENTSEVEEEEEPQDEEEEEPTQKRKRNIYPVEEEQPLKKRREASPESPASQELSDDTSDNTSSITSDDTSNTSDEERMMLRAWTLEGWEEDRETLEVEDVEREMETEQQIAEEENESEEETEKEGGEKESEKDAETAMEQLVLLPTVVEDRETLEVERELETEQQIAEEEEKSEEETEKEGGEKESEKDADTAMEQLGLLPPVVEDLETLNIEDVEREMDTEQQIAEEENESEEETEKEGGEKESEKDADTAMEQLGLLPPVVEDDRDRDREIASLRLENGNLINKLRKTHQELNLCRENLDKYQQELARVVPLHFHTQMVADKDLQIEELRQHVELLRQQQQPQLPPPPQQAPQLPPPPQQAPQLPPPPQQAPQLPPPPQQAPQLPPPPQQAPQLPPPPQQAPQLPPPPQQAPQLPPPPQVHPKEAAKFRRLAKLLLTEIEGLKEYEDIAYWIPHDQQTTLKTIRKRVREKTLTTLEEVEEQLGELFTQLLRTCTEAERKQVTTVLGIVNQQIMVMHANIGNVGIQHRQMRPRQ